MLGRHVYRVTPASRTEEGAWVVRKDGEAEPFGQSSTKDEAVELACRLAAQDEPAKVTVENADGTLAEERVFGVDPGQDPAADPITRKGNLEQG